MLIMPLNILLLFSYIKHSKLPFLKISYNYAITSFPFFLTNSPVYFLLSFNFMHTPGIFQSITYQYLRYKSCT